MAKENTFTVTMTDSWYEKRFPTTDSQGNTYWLYMRGVTYENGDADITMYKNCKEYPPPNQWSKSYYYYTDCIGLGSATIKVGQYKDFDEGKCRVRLNSTGGGGANFTVIVDLAPVVPEPTPTPSPPPAVQKPEPKIISYNIPTTQPQIDGLMGVVTIQNAGNAEGRFRYKLIDRDTNEIKSTDEFSLRAGETRDIYLWCAIPCKTMNMRFTLEALIDGAWSGPYIDFMVTPCYPRISISELRVPKRARPGNTINLTCRVKNSGCIGIATAPMWFGLLGEESYYSIDERRIGSDQEIEFTHVTSMVGGDASGKFMARWKKCMEYPTSEEMSFTIAPEDCLLITVPKKGWARIISALGKTYEFYGVIIGDDITSVGMEREIGGKRLQYFKGVVSGGSEAKITWSDISYLRIEFKEPILVVENKVILGEMDCYSYSDLKLPLIRLRSLRYNLRKGLVK